MSFAVFRLRVWPKWRQGSGTCSPYLCPSTLSIFDFVAPAIVFKFFCSRLYSAPKIKSILWAAFSSSFQLFIIHSCAVIVNVELVMKGTGINWVRQIKLVIKTTNPLSGKDNDGKKNVTAYNRTPKRNRKRVSPQSKLMECLIMTVADIKINRRDSVSA